MRRPGEYIQDELLKDNMSRKDLALRTGVTEKHISTVINGERPISMSFAKKLGYVFENMDFWLQKQNDYDQELLKEKEKNSISEAEISILKRLKEITNYLIEKSYLENATNEAIMVLQLRNFFKVSDLTVIPKLSYNGAYRAQMINNITVDPYILYAWQRLCEKETEDIIVNQGLNKSLLQEKLDDIKELMFCDIRQSVIGIKKILSDCGIAFNVVKNFRGAPVQGFIKQSTDEKLILCLTIRGKKADTFWFTLFHEIGHILHEDYRNLFIDFQSINTEEERANLFAMNTLINPESYRNFVFSSEKITWNSIKEFSKKIKVQPYIVLGRLQRDEIVDWSEYSEYVEKYNWSQLYN